MSDPILTDNRISEPHQNDVQPGRRSQFGAIGILTAGCFLAALVSALMLGAVAVVTSYEHNGTRDFVEYWAAGVQLVHGQNPYDVDAIWKLEKSAGSRFSVVLMNPPFIMSIVAPLGVLDSVAAARWWLLLQIVSCAASFLAIASAFKKTTAIMVSLLGLCFAPILICILIGQIGVFLLLGIALFLALHAKQPFVAGAVLLPCAMKPHLFIPFAIVLLLWVIKQRAYRLLAGFVASIVLSASVAYWFDPQIWRHWIGFLHFSQPANTPIWNISRILRLAIGPQLPSVQFVPVLAASGWSIWHFRKQQHSWSWIDQGLFVLLLSVVCAPYSWLTDEAVLLPCLVAAVHHAQNNGRSLLPLAAMMATASLELISGRWIDTGALVWTAPAWLAFYLYATRKNRPDVSDAVRQLT